MPDTTHDSLRGHDPLPGAAVAPASYAQQRMWFFERLQPGSAIYTISRIEMLAGRLDAPALRRALDALVRRHDALHVTFEERDGRAVQILHPPQPAEVTFHDLTDRSHEARGRELERIIAEAVARGFDLERGPLLRFAVVSVEPGRQMVFMTIHHIVCDLWSISVFSRDLAALYGAAREGRPSPLPDLPRRFRDVVAAQRARYEGGRLDPQLAYWRERLRGLPATTEMPIDRPRPPVQTYRGAGWKFVLPAAVAEPFRGLVRSAGATLFMGLFAAYAVLLHRESGQSDLAVGTPIANRGGGELDGMIGLFFNMVALRIDLSDDPTVAELLARVRVDRARRPGQPGRALRAPRRGAASPERDPSRQPLFQTMFVLPAQLRPASTRTDVGDRDRADRRQVRHHADRHGRRAGSSPDRLRLRHVDLFMRATRSQLLARALSTR